MKLRALGLLLLLSAWHPTGAADGENVGDNSPGAAKAAAEEDGEAAAEGAKTTEADKSYPSWNGRLDGDSVRLMVNVYGLHVFGSSGKQTRCAAAQSRARVVSDDGKVLTLRFSYVARSLNAPTFGNDPMSFEACPAKNSVSEGVQYTIDRATFMSYDHRLTGLSFGGLVVPFKYYLAGDRRLAASSTLAPYLGIRFPFFYGTTVTPIFSAGLGLVPIESEDPDASGTKAALSTAIGFVLTSSKNDSLNSGIIFGRDFLGKNDRGEDDTVNKAWFSIYVGYSPRD